MSRKRKTKPIVKLFPKKKKPKYPKMPPPSRDTVRRNSKKIGEQVKAEHGEWKKHERTLQQ